MGLSWGRVVVGRVCRKVALFWVGLVVERVHLVEGLSGIWVCLGLICPGWDCLWMCLS